MSRPTKALLSNLPHSTAGGRVVTIDDVVQKAAIWLAYAIGVAVGGYLTAPTVFEFLSPLVLLGAVVGMALLDIFIYRAATPPNGLMAVSLGAYGWLVGAISWAYASTDRAGLGLITTAAIATAVTAVVVIAMYKMRILKAETHKFRATVAAACIGYLAVVLGSLALQAFSGPSLFGDGALGWALCAFGTVLAALSLTMAAADIDMAIAEGAPASEASRLGWAFVSTLLWLYLEILRLLGRSRN